MYMAILQFSSIFRPIQLQCLQSPQGKLVFGTGERGLPSLNRGYRTPDPSLSRLPKCPLASRGLTGISGWCYFAGKSSPNNGLILPGSGVMYRYVQWLAQNHYRKWGKSLGCSVYRPIPGSWCWQWFSFYSYSNPQKIEKSDPTEIVVTRSIYELPISFGITNGLLYGEMCGQRS